MIALAGVAVLAVAGVAITVLSAVAGRHPDRAALLVVLVAAAAGMAAFGLVILAVLTFGLGPQAANPIGGRAAGYAPLRLAAGLAVATILALTALWLIRAGDWRSPDS
jgi:hypothetical protein